MPRGFFWLLSAQFVSGLADNALLIVAIAHLPGWGLPAWVAPLLKLSFTLAYVGLAPLVGALADAAPKARVMMASNALKAAGLVALMAGLHPLAAFAVIGLGAAVYAPAKYGLVTELAPSARLVAANGWLEVTMVGAILLGTVAGGGLSVPGWLPLAMPAVLALYTLAAMLNLGVPASGRAVVLLPAPLHAAPRRLWRQFGVAQRTLWRDREGALSLAATTLFWGAGATMQFAVLRWATERLGLSLDRAALLQAVVAVGVVVGAAAAGRWVPLHAARRVLPCGVALGLLVPVVALVDSVALAVPLLVAVGAMGGALVVPMNALLQHRGVQLLSPGRSIAVQNFNENASVLVMLAVYAALGALQVPLLPLMAGFGLVVAAASAVLVSWSAGAAGSGPRPAAAGRRPWR
ncbi:lysophospholipid transporter LplT [Rubrivivax albus]|uniref:Lysophospholipid transporter LplT n=2 Tax=Rubrivivax albus TaxID=2499835 RepID=A0A3S2U4F9_9BURK|nr:lysophospholipid transporter LplT [Rubrivivax albus]